MRASVHWIYNCWTLQALFIPIFIYQNVKVTYKDCKDAEGGNAK